MSAPARIATSRRPYSPELAAAHALARADSFTVEEVRPDLLSGFIRQTELPGLSLAA